MLKQHYSSLGMGIVPSGNAHHRYRALSRETSSSSAEIEELVLPHSVRQGCKNQSAQCFYCRGTTSVRLFWVVTDACIDNRGEIADLSVTIFPG
jgi:hypothetical protein